MNTKWIYLLISTLFFIEAHGQSKNINVTESNSNSDKRTVKSSKALANNEPLDLWQSEPFGKNDPTKEVITKRDMFSKHFRNSDGTISAHVASGPIHYFEDGKWKTIYHKIEPSNNGGFENTRNSIKTYYPASVNNGGVVTKFENGLTFSDLQEMEMYYESGSQISSLTYPTSNEGIINNNTLLYPAVYGPSIDIRFTQNTLQRKMDYILKDVSALSSAPTNGFLVFKEVIHLPIGITAELHDNVIHFKDQAGFIVATVEKPIIHDSKRIEKSSLSGTNEKKPLNHEKEKNYTEGIYSISQSGLNLTILTKVNLDWLMDQNREYPIIVDPTTSYYPDNTTNWTGYFWSDINSKQSGQMYIGSYDPSVVYRGWAKFNVTGIPDGSTVSDVVLYVYENYDYAADIDIAFTQLTTEPVAQAASGLNAAISSGTAYASLVDAPGFEDGVGWYSKDLTSTADSYLEGTSLGVNWFAVGFKCSYAEYNDDYVRLDGYAESNNPYISVTYTPVSLEITWEGDESIVWNIPGNWSTNSVPNAFDNVTIPSGTSYSPTIAASTVAACNDLIINTGATLTLATSVSGGGDLTVSGNIDNDGTINHSGDVILYMDGASKTIGGDGTFTTFGVLVDNGGSISLANSISILQLDIYNNGSSSFNLNSYTCTVTTAHDQSGVLNLSTGTLEYQGAPGDHTFTDSRLTEASGTFYYNGINNSQTVKTGTYWNLKIGTQNGNTATIGSSSAITVSNDLTIVNPSTAGGIASTAYDITVGNNFNLGNTGNALTLNLSKRLYRSSGTGTLTMGNVSDHAINASYSDATNFVMSGFGTPTFYGTFTYNGTGTQKVITGTYMNLVSTNSGTRTQSGDIDVDGNISFTGGNFQQSTHAINVAGNWTSSGNYYEEGTGVVTFDGSGTSAISGTSAVVGALTGTPIYTDNCESSTGWTLDGGTANWVLITPTGTNSPALDNSAGGTMCFKTAAASTAYAATKTYVLTSPTIDLTGYTNCSLSFYMWMDSEGTTSLYDGGFIEVYNGTAWVPATGSVAYDGTLSSTYSNPYGGTSSWSYDRTTWTQITVNISAHSGISTFKIRFKFGSDSGTQAGGWAIDDLAVTGDVAGVAYSGEAFKKFTINKTGGGFVNLTSDTWSTTDFTLTSGKVKTNGYTLTLGTDGSNATISSGSSTTYIEAYDNAGTIGYVKQFINSNTSYTFPIGDGTNYTPLTFTLSAGSLSSAYITSYTKAEKIADMNSGITTYINRFWEVTPSGITSPTYDINYTYVDGDIVGTESDMLPIKLSGSTWYKPNGSSFTDGTEQGTGSVDVGSNTLTWTGLSTFSFMGGAGDAPVLLPIELLFFDANKVNDIVLVDWTTASEVNNDYFTLERSADAIQFEQVSIINGAGNSTGNIHYEYVDREFYNGINYYRLKQTDFDGAFKYSNTVAVFMGNNSDKSLVMTVNYLGQEVNDNYRGLVFDVFSDGTSVKRFQ